MAGFSVAHIVLRENRFGRLLFDKGQPLDQLKSSVLQPVVLVQSADVDLV